MVCAYRWEDNPRGLASGLSPVHVHNHTITALLTSMHVHFVHCEISDVKHSNITQRCNKVIKRQDFSPLLKFTKIKTNMS